MPIQVVRTKLFIPGLRPDLIARRRLTETGPDQPGLRVTVVSAPPGFGKTTLLASWARATLSGRGRVAWVSLDEGDRDPLTFWTYVVTAVDLATDGAVSGALHLLGDASLPVGATLATLVNELDAWPGTLEMVLDDFHRADNAAITTGLEFVLLNVPPRIRLVIGSRADPGLPLARLRARGELLEVRAADLRLTSEEMTTYFREVAGLSLHRREIAALDERTEGWIAAVQLAGLSLQGRADAADFIATFAGDHRYIVDYLAEEVLRQLPEHVRAFLVSTSILDRFCASLCDAVTAGADGRAMLDLIERSNLFLVPLDETRHWYRYHHLFADVLAAQLAADGADVTTLHTRAARWYAAADDPQAAVRHAVAAGDVELAADVIERSAIALLRERKETVVRQWISQIPAEIVHRRPVLAIGFIGALMSCGALESIPDRLAELEQVLADPPADLVVLDRAELLRVPGAIATYRAALALTRGDAGSAIAHAGRAVALAAPGDDLTLAAAGALSGLASWGRGDLDLAYAAYTRAIVGLERAGNHADVLGCLLTLADIRITQGRLGDADGIYARGRAAAREVGSVLRGTADMIVGQAEVALERGEFARAGQLLDEVDRLGEPHGLPQHPYRRRVARARLREVSGDLTGAVALLDEAAEVYVGDYSPNVRPVPAQRARVLLAQGRLPEALAWAQHRQLTPAGDRHYLREYEHLTLARILLQQSASERSAEAAQAAYDLLRGLREDAESAGRGRSVIEILALLAMAHHRLHGRRDVERTLAILRDAVRLAEVDGHVLVISALGPAMAGLLETLTRADPSWSYPRRLLAHARPAQPASRGHGQGLVDPLSPRELDVLRLLRTDLDGPAIAKELMISLNTMRTHTKSIYAKLGVTSRRAAVTRAAELRLLSRDP